MRALLWLAALAIAAFVSAPGVAAIAAPTAAATLTHSSVSSAVEPLHANELPTVTSHCPYHSNHFTTYTDGCRHWINWACVTFHHFNISPPDFASNDCPQAVDLWTGKNETGHAICVPGDHRTGHLNTARRSFKIQDGGTC